MPIAENYLDDKNLIAEKLFLTKCYGRELQNIEGDLQNPGSSQALNMRDVEQWSLNLTTTDDKGANNPRRDTGKETTADNWQ